MKRLFLLLAIVSLSCGVQAQLSTVATTPLPATQTPLPAFSSPTATISTVHIPTVQITANVHIRNYAGIVVGTLLEGESVAAWCGWEVCYLDDGDTFWRSCSSAALPNSKCLRR